MNEMDFSIATPSANQKELLKQAINEINALPGHLSDSIHDGQAKQAELLAKIMDDAVLLPELPVMHKITDDNFIKEQYQLPIDISQQLQNNHFYWLQIPVGIYAKENWRYSRIEVGISMNTVPGKDVPRAIRILPEKEFQQLFEITTEGQVGLDANFNFSGKTAQYDFAYNGNELHVGAGAAADGGFKAKMVYGPLSFKIRKTIIDRSAANMHTVKWVLNDTQKIEDGFDLIGIVQVPKTYNDFSISAEVRARRSLSDIPDLAGLFEFLSNSIKNLFKTGCPTQDTKLWDLKQFL